MLTLLSTLKQALILMPNKWGSVKPSNEFFSRELRFALGTDEVTGMRYASFPVTIGIADYEEFYRLSEEQYTLFLADTTVALAFVKECRQHEHDDLLLEEPWANRGIGT